MSKPELISKPSRMPDATAMSILFISLSVGAFEAGEIRRIPESAMKLNPIYSTRSYESAEKIRVQFLPVPLLDSVDLLSLRAHAVIRAGGEVKYCQSGEGHPHISTLKKWYKIWRTRIEQTLGY